ncbi:MAG: transcriptional repressor [Bacteroidaceae bacterium]|nr:transcriptional repressor [Bacteroidaceae bacterium]
MSEKAFTAATTVEQRFRDFLLANDLRLTRERLAILEAVYGIDGTFTIENLRDIMAQTHFHVSTATLYNTTLLLVQANLLVRHPFSSSSAVFERIYDDRPRTYQVCNQCHHITLIKSRDLSTAVQSYKPRRFEVTHRITYIYGICPKCERAMRQRIKIIETKR